MTLRRCVFIDRDDTIAKDVPYCDSPDKFHLFPGIPEQIKRLNDAGFLVIVITNQSGIGRGYFTEDTLAKIHEKMKADIEAGGGPLDAIYYCPHTPDEDCNCRKPRTGLIEAACRDFAIDLARSWMVGDKAADIELAKNVHLRAAQFLPKEESQLLPGAEFAVRSLSELSSRILA